MKQSQTTREKLGYCRYSLETALPRSKKLKSVKFITERCLSGLHASKLLHIIKVAVFLKEWQN